GAAGRARRTDRRRSRRAGTIAAAALLARKVARGGLPTPLTARDVYRNAWTGLTEPRVVHRTLGMLADWGWIRAELAQAADGGRPTVRFHINPTVRRARHDESAR